MNVPITPRQHEVYRFIVGYVKKHGYAPTLREIGEAFGFGSLGTVHGHVARLQEYGLIERERYRHNGIILVNDKKSAIFGDSSVPKV